MAAAPSSPPENPLRQLRPAPHRPMGYGPFREELDANGHPLPGRVLQFPTYGHLVIRWIETHCRFTSRGWSRRPVRLQDWQKQLIIDLFELDPATGLRRYRWALIGMPRKNGKTELMAMLALWFLLGEQTKDTPVIVVAATSDRQANLIFSAAARMAVYSPTLARRVDVFGSEIQNRANPEAKIVRVSSKARTAHGLNISHLICDELHEWPAGAGDDLWDVLTTSMSAGEDPLVLQITTAGYDLDNTKCGEQYRHGRAVESGEERDDAYFFRWWQAPDGCNIRDPEAHRIANPAYGVIKAPKWFADMVSRLRPALFRRLELNQWTSLATSWLPEGAWHRTYAAPPPLEGDIEERLARVRESAGDRARAAYPPVDDEDLSPAAEFVRAAIRSAEARILVEADIVERALRLGLRPGLPCYAGWDGSAKLDSTAVVFAQQQGVRVRFVAWIWDRQWDPSRNRYAADWVVPSDEVRLVIETINRWFALEAVAFDPQLIRQDAMALEREGIVMLEIKQAGSVMEQASQGLYEVIVSERAAHAQDVEHAPFDRHIHNAAARQSRLGAAAWRLVKADAPRKMDGAVAAAMAVWALQNPPEKPKPPAPVIARVFFDDDGGDEVEAI